MKTKQFLKPIIALIAIIATAFPSLAHDFVVDGIYYNINPDGTSVSVTFRGPTASFIKDEYIEDVVIPENVTYNNNKYTVTAIGKEAFFDCSSLLSISIPNTVTHIGERAFEHCSYLGYDTPVIIPNSVISISKHAFSWCIRLKSITFGESVKTIEGGALWY